MRPPIIAVQGVSDLDEVPGLAAAAAHCELRAAADAAALRKALAGADVLLGWNFAARDLQEAWDAAGALRWIHWCGAGVDAALFEALVASPVLLTNARGVFDAAMAEYTLGLVLAMAKQLPRTLELQRERRWQHRLTETIAGRRALVVGAGSIGRAIARQLRAAGLRVDGVARSGRAADPDFDTLHGQAELDAQLPGADYVILITPLTPATRGLFDAARIARMAAHARFINLGRGALVEEDALIEALAGARLAGAALDVFASEPLPGDSPLWTLPNVIVSPHMSGDFIGSKPALAERFFANLSRYEAGQPLLNVVDKRAGFVPYPGA